MSTSLTRGDYDRQTQWSIQLPWKRNAHSSHKYPVTLVEVEVWVREERLTSILPNQSNDIMVEDVEREALSDVSLEVQLKEVVPPIEEIPSMVQLDAPQLGEFVMLILGSESVVDGGCRENGSRANGTSDELVVLAGDGIQDGGVEGGHGEGKETRTRGCGVLFQSSRIGSVYSLRIVGDCSSLRPNPYAYCRTFSLLHVQSPPFIGAMEYHSLKELVVKFESASEA